MVFTSTDAYPQSDRWLSLMAQGFLRGDIVVGYCGFERHKGLKNYFMRAWRMMHSVPWLARAIARRPYRGTLHNIGFTKTIYFGANGFGQLNMNIGEDDPFMQQIMTRDNVSVVLTPRATLHEKTWGGWAGGSTGCVISVRPSISIRKRSKTICTGKSVRACSFSRPSSAR